jgi:hypothetical protein
MSRLGFQVTLFNLLCVSFGTFFSQTTLIIPNPRNAVFSPLPFQACAEKYLISFDAATPTQGRDIVSGEGFSVTWRIENTGSQLSTTMNVELWDFDDSRRKGSWTVPVSSRSFSGTLPNLSR